MQEEQRRQIIERSIFAKISFNKEKAKEIKKEEQYAIQRKRSEEKDYVMQMKISSRREKEEKLQEIERYQ